MQTCRFGLNSSRARDNFLIAALFLWRNNFFLFGEINFCIVILVYFFVDVFAQVFVVSVSVWNESEIEEQITDNFGRRRLLNFGNLWEKNESKVLRTCYSFQLKAKRYIFRQWSTRDPCSSSKLFCVLFLPVEHRSWNTGWKTPVFPPPTPGKHLEVFRQACFT